MFLVCKLLQGEGPQLPERLKSPVTQILSNTPAPVKGEPLQARSRDLSIPRGPQADGAQRSGPALGPDTELLPPGAGGPCTLRSLRPEAGRVLIISGQARPNPCVGQVGKAPTFHSPLALLLLRLLLLLSFQLLLLCFQSFPLVDFDSGKRQAED